jgi:hypothetical protein
VRHTRAAARAGQLLLALAFVVCGGATARAQTSDAEKKAQDIISPNAFRIEFKKIPELPKGKISMAEGTAGPDGVKFVAENLSILQPVVVTVLAKHAEDDVQVRLSKYRYDQADRTGTTKGKGMYTTKLRTQGDLKVVVAAPRPTPFQLIVWAGDELKPELPALVVTDPDRVQGKSSGGGVLSGGPVLWVIAGSLIVIAGLLAVRTFKGKQS